jgi:hypothetical protein
VWACLLRIYYLASSRSGVRGRVLSGEVVVACYVLLDISEVLSIFI